MANELSELHERAERGREHPETVPITVTLAILAVLLAVCGLLGHRAHNEALLFQIRATDQWAYYQSRNIRLHGDRVFLDEMTALQPKPSPALDKLQNFYQSELHRYSSQSSQLADQSRALEAEVARQQRRGNRFDAGEILLESSIVIVSIALLVGRRFFWMIGVAMGVAGLIIAATGMLV